MAANGKSSGKQGAGAAVAQELALLRRKVKDLTARLESEVKARKLDARVATEARKARDELNKQVKLLSDQGRKMAAQLKSTLGDAGKRQQALKDARGKVSDLRAELGRKAGELKRTTEELKKIAVESAHRAASVMRGDREHAANPFPSTPSEPPPMAPPESGESASREDPFKTS